MLDTARGEASRIRGEAADQDLDQNLEGEKAILIMNGSGLGAEITSEERILSERAASR